MTQTTLHTYFGYRDAPSAIDWLGRAFGFDGNEWGSYRFRVLDPEGFEWSFTTHQPGVS